MKQHARTGAIPMAVDDHSTVPSTRRSVFDKWRYTWNGSEDLTRPLAQGVWSREEELPRGRVALETE